MTATDVSPAMLARAETLAMQEGLANVRFEVVDAHELPYPAGSFDVVTCRFAVMYFADPIAVFRRVRSSLAADGRFASLVWGDPSQPILSCTFGPAQRLLGLPTMPAGAPSATRYSEPGSLTADLLAAGFAHVEERTYSFDAISRPRRCRCRWLRCGEPGVPRAVRGPVVAATIGILGVRCLEG